MYFEDTDYLMTEHGEGYDETRNPEILKDLMEYVNNIKSKDRETPILDIIMEYTFKNDYDVDVIGDIIAEDPYFKSFVESDCNFRLKETEEW